MPRTPFRRAFPATLALGLVLVPLASGINLPGADPVPEPEATRAILDVTGLIDPDDWPTVPLHTPMPADAYGIGPGQLLLIAMPGGTYICTANFLWEGTNGKTYLGSAGHCFVPPGKTATHGPGKDYDPNLTRVFACVSACSTGAVGTPHLKIELGPVAYARQTLWGDDLGNDFGIVEIPQNAMPYIRREMPVFGGPTQVGNVFLGNIGCHYGHASGLGESWVTEARVGVGWSTTNAAIGEWRALLAAYKGDSGSAFAVCVQDEGGLHGKTAVGVLTHISPPFIVGTTIAKAQAMTQQDAGITIAPLLPPA